MGRRREDEVQYAFYYIVISVHPSPKHPGWQVVRCGIDIYMARRKHDGGGATSNGGVAESDSEPA